MDPEKDEYEESTTIWQSADRDGFYCVLAGFRASNVEEAKEVEDRIHALLSQREPTPA